MSESLAIYLHDHLTGASMAIELLESRQKEEYVGAAWRICRKPSDRG
jgi:hypothetical protein